MESYNTHILDGERFGKCEVCLEYLPLEHYFKKGDTIICKECETEYSIVSLNPVKLSIINNRYPDGYIHDQEFDE